MYGESCIIAHSIHPTSLRRVRQRIHPAQRQQPRPRQVPMHGLWPPRQLCAGGVGAGRSLRQGGKATGQAQFAAQYRLHGGRFVRDGDQTGKKSQAASQSLPRLRPIKARLRKWEALELDEIWTFVGHCRRIVVKVLGRDAATERRRRDLPLPAALLTLHQPAYHPCGRTAPLALPLLRRHRWHKHHRDR